MRHVILSMTTVLMTNHVAIRASAQVPRLDEICIKGTHNSYSCCGDNDCPVMNHHPVDQIDEFGVWALELDFDIVLEGSEPRAYVGHNCICGAGCWTHESWGTYLGSHEDPGYFERIRSTESFNHRPILLYLEKKDWANISCPWSADWDEPGGDDLQEGMWLGVVVRDLRAAFGDACIFGPAKRDSPPYNGQWPPITDLAGMVVPVAIHGIQDGVVSDWVFSEDPDGVTLGILRHHEDHCTTSTEIQGIAGPGVVLGLDQYQYDWTFDLIAPPNPLCVQAGAPGGFVARNNNEDPDPNDGPKDCWTWDAWPDDDCDDCGYNGYCTECCFTVSQQGTFRFPYDMVGEAHARALDGWTILIQAGNYPETVTLNKRVTLLAEGGTVTIGQ